MQVKKFEAKTMKEALEMVKNQLGPEAIILGARDNNRGFGLLGKTSVEVTAAVSESMLQRKRFAEARVQEPQREKLKSSSAKMQKQFIDKSVNRYVQSQPATAAPMSYASHIPREITSIPYADIGDDEIAAPAYSGKRVDTLLSNMVKTVEFEAPSPATNIVNPRIKQAIKSAAEIFQNKIQVDAPVVENSAELSRLQTEIASLRKVIEDLHKIPRGTVQAHPGAEYEIPFELSDMLERLKGFGISGEFSVAMMKQAQRDLGQDKIKNKNLVEAWTARHLLHEIKVSDSALGGKYHIFLGAAGHGKTSSLVKLAGHLSKEKKKIAIVSAGPMRIGATDQMKIYSHLLNAQFGIVKNASDWSRLIPEFADVDYVLVDYPGASLKTEEEVQALRAVMPPAHLDKKVHLVLMTAVKDADALELGRRYLPVHFDDLIITHLEESVNHGILFNLQKSFNVPIHSFGIGPAIPDDYEFATKERILSLIFKMQAKLESER